MSRGLGDVYKRQEELLAPSFHYTETGSDRTISRNEAIDAIVTIREKYSKHQFDLKHAYCLSLIHI